MTQKEWRMYHLCLMICVVLLTAGITHATAITISTAVYTFPVFLVLLGLCFGVFGVIEWDATKYDR